MNFTFPISLAATYILISFFIFLVNKSNIKYKGKMTKNDFVVKFPKIFPISTFFASLFALTIIFLMHTLSYNPTATLEVCIIFSILMLLCLICTFATTREKLIVKGDNIEYYPPFAKKRKYTFNDITNISIRTRQSAEFVICYKNNKRIFTIHSALAGYELFLSRVKNKPDIKSKNET